MTIMMLREQEFVGIAQSLVDVVQLAPQHVLLEELLRHPHRQRLAKRREATWHERHVRLEQALELEKGLVIEYNVVDPLLGRFCLGKTPANSIRWETGIMLFAREALLLRGGNDVAVTNQRGCTVVIER